MTSRRERREVGLRRWAVVQARERGDIDFLRRSLTDPETRRLAAAYLAQWRADEAIPDLIRMSRAADAGARLSALHALADLGATEAMDMFEEIARDDRAYLPMRGWAFKGLSRVGGDRAFQTLMDVFRSTSDPDVKRAALASTVLLNDPRAIPVIRDEARKLSWYRRRPMLRAAKELARNAPAESPVGQD